MKAPDVDITAVVRIECLTERARELVRHRLEWGLRWGPSDPRQPHTRHGWVVSQRYATRTRDGATVYPWIDLFDVLVGGREFARGFVIPWIYARADQLVTNPGHDLLEPWQYTKGLTREERLGEKRKFQVTVMDTDGRAGDDSASGSTSGGASGGAVRGMVL